jgi:hypothetical protein
MSKPLIYQIHFCGEWLATIEVRDLKLAQEKCTETNDFFSNNEERLSDAGGDVIAAALCLYAPMLLDHAGFGEGVTSEWIGRQEGHYPLDGSAGLLLTELSWDIKNRDSFQITGGPR